MHLNQRIRFYLLDLLEPMDPPDIDIVLLVASETRPHHECTVHVLHVQREPMLGGLSHRQRLTNTSNSRV